MTESHRTGQQQSLGGSSVAPEANWWASAGPMSPGLGPELSMELVQETDELRAQQVDLRAEEAQSERQERRVGAER